jgi:hypothetical protein
MTQSGVISTAVYRSNITDVVAVVAFVLFTRSLIGVEFTLQAKYCNVY